MIKRAISASVLVFWVLGAVGLAQEVEAGSQEAKDALTRPMRIGVVRVQDVFKDFQYARDQEQKIKDEFTKQKEQIEALKNQIDEKTQHLRHDPLIRPGSKKFLLERLEIQRLEIELEDMRKQFEQEVRKRMAEFYRSIYDQFRTVVLAVGEKYQYDLIITAPSPDLSKEGEGADNPEAIRTEILLRRVQYIGKRQGVDITDFVVQQMNDRYAKMKKAGTVNPN